MNFNKSFSAGNVVTIFVILCGLAVQWGGWSSAMQSMDRRLAKVELEVATFIPFKAETQANRFTSNDAIALVRPVTEAIIQNDKRITRLEDAHAASLALLSRIEKKIDGKGSE